VEPSVDLEGRITALPLADLPIVCEQARGTLDAALDARTLGQPTARLRFRARSDALRLGEASEVAASAEVTLDAQRLEAELELRAREGGAATVTLALPFTLGEDGMTPALAEGGALDLRARFDDFSLEPIT